MTTEITEMLMEGVREYGDELPVRIRIHKGRQIIVADNEAGFCSTYVDLADVLLWLKNNKPETLYNIIGKE